MALLGQWLGRLAGYAFLYGLTAAAIVFTAAILLGALVGERADDIGTQRIACLVGWQIAEEPCPRIEDAAARAREALRGAQSELDTLREERRRLEEMEARADSYTLFSTEELAGASGVEVTAGTVFASLLEGARPTSRYCYVRRHHDGIFEQLGIETDGRPDSVTRAQASKLGLTLDQVTAARALCRYADEGSGA
jgi:hypothetical protein